MSGWGQTSGLTSFLFQSATNLTPTVTWTDVVNGGRLWTEPMTNQAKFFRVVK